MRILIELLPLIIGILLVPIVHKLYMTFMVVLATFKIDKKLIEKYRTRGKHDPN